MAAHGALHAAVAADDALARRRAAAAGVVMMDASSRLHMRRTPDEKYTPAALGLYRYFTGGRRTNVTHASQSAVSFQLRASRCCSGKRRAIARGLADKEVAGFSILPPNFMLVA